MITDSDIFGEDAPTFAARAPWWGGDLQTVRNALLPRPRLPGGAGERLEFPTSDGAGDRLLARFHKGDPGRPLALLIHGLTGCEDSVYVRASAAHLLDRGHPVLRLNLRGAGPSRDSCRERYHAGRSEDLRAVFAALPAALTASGVVAIGYSLGGNILLKTLGEAGPPPQLRAAAAVSAPVDLAAAWRRFSRPRNRLYHRWLLARMKKEALAPAVALDARERAAVKAAATVREFDEVFVAPRNGFADAADYYARCSALRFLDRIEAPTLIFHADDDPWIPAAPLRDYDWTRAPACRLLLCRGGGHVGFHGQGGAVAWHDRCAARFFDAVSAAGYPAARRSAAARAK